MQLLHILLLIALLWLVVLNIDEEEFEKRNIERLPIALLWRTERGLEGVDYFAKKARRFWGLLSDLGILISIPLMAFVLYELTMSARHILVAPEAPPGIAPALPGLRIPGSPIYIPFWYGIFALMTVLVAHEIMHGIITKAEGLRLKSLGILFVTLVPLGAFAEPDEDELERSSKRTKLRVYAAGSFGNFLLVILSIFLISTIIAPGMFQEDYVNISRVFPNTPAEVYGLRENTTLISINGVRVNTME
ncbi:MAG: site-2 protease family protein, partial [Candidatus Hydrothermarchaeales archaeon]